MNRNTTQRHGGRSRMRVATLVVGFIVGFIAVFFLYRQHIIHPNIKIDFNEYPVRGIDVSAHNGTIDFAKVAGEGNTFVYIKASEGTSFHDSLFVANSRAAKRVGLKVGAYHFFRKSRDGEQQARNFIAAIKDSKLDLPVVIDIEDWNNDKDVDNATVVKRLKTMVDLMQGEGYTVMIYTNGDGYKTYYQDSGLSDLPLWICSFKEPKEIADKQHAFHQYSHWGEVQGIKGDVDLDIFNGSQEQWLDFLNSINPKP